MHERKNVEPPTTSVEPTVKKKTPYPNGVSVIPAAPSLAHLDRTQPYWTA